MTKDILPPAVRQALERGNKIEAIKELRSITGLGLKEAKDWIESYERGGQPPALPSYEHPEGRDPNVSFTLTTEALDALKRGSTIEAITIVRERSGVGLAEAKDIVEMIQKAMPGAIDEPPPTMPTTESVRTGQRLAPGEVASGGGVAKWLALIAVAALVVIVVLSY